MSIEKLISDLVAVAKVEKIPVSTLIQRGLTLDERIPEEDILTPLTSAECYAVECIANKHRSFSIDGQISLERVMNFALVAITYTDEAS